MLDWGIDNKTTFEPSKTAALLVSNKKKPFDISGCRMSWLRMGRAAVEIVEEMRLVGFWIDNKLNFGGMVSRLAKKARCQIGALRRLQPVLNAENRMTVYKMFIRSIM